MYLQANVGYTLAAPPDGRGGVSPLPALKSQTGSQWLTTAALPHSKLLVQAHAVHDERKGAEYV